MEASGPVAILAGSGRLPLLVTDCLRRRGREHRVLAFRGFAAAAIRNRADAVVDLLDVKRTLDWLARWSPAGVTLAGAVQRPQLSAFLNAFSAFSNRRELAELMRRGDDQLLRAAVGLIERQGHRIVGIHDLAPELLARAGVLATVAPDATDQTAIATGMRLLADLSPYDVGQATTVSGARIIAVEGPEGTDKMLARVAGLRRLWSRASIPSGGVLVKSAKRGQDLRIDLPAIGARTVVKGHAAGLKGIAVGSGSTLLLDEQEIVATADRLGLFVVGVETTWPDAVSAP